MTNHEARSEPRTISPAFWISAVVACVALGMLLPGGGFIIVITSALMPRARASKPLLATLTVVASLLLLIVLAALPGAGFAPVSS